MPETGVGSAKAVGASNPAANRAKAANIKRLGNDFFSFTILLLPIQRVLDCLVIE